MTKDKMVEAFVLEFLLHRRFMSYFNDATGPCGSPLDDLYDTSNLRLTCLGWDPDTPVLGEWDHSHIGVAMLAGVYDPATHCFYVISFTINDIEPEGIEISVYDIFELSGSGTKFFIESHGAPLALKIVRDPAHKDGNVMGWQCQGQKKGGWDERLASLM